MSNKQYETGVLEGIASWAHLTEGEVFQGTPTGKLSITVQPSKTDADKMQQIAADCFDAFKAENAKKKFTGEPNLGAKEDKDGNIVFKFVANEKIHTKNGQELKKTIPIFDGAGREVTKKIKGNIGNGSIIAVSYQLFPYLNSSRVFGVSLRLQGIQIIKYVPYGGHDAASMGFARHDDAFNGSSIIAGNDEEDAASDVPFPTEEDF